MRYPIAIPKRRDGLLLFYDPKVARSAHHRLHGWPDARIVVIQREDDPSRQEGFAIEVARGRYLREGGWIE